MPANISHYKIRYNIIPNLSLATKTETVKMSIYEGRNKAKHEDKDEKRHNEFT